MQPVLFREPRARRIEAFAAALAARAEDRGERRESRVSTSPRCAATAPAARVLQRATTPTPCATPVTTSAAPRTPLLTARGLACDRGTRSLFDRLDLDLHAGELLWIRGRNGRGKTSLLRLLAGIAVPAAGEVRLHDEIVGETHGSPAGILYIGHSDALKDDLSLAEALAFLLRIHGHAGDPASVDATLAHWGLLDRRDAPVGMLSQGQRRRLALARLGVERNASLWILDEPFDALDSDGGDRLNALLAEHLGDGGGVLCTGHDARLAPGLGARELDLDRC